MLASLAVCTGKKYLTLANQVEWIFEGHFVQSFLNEDYSFIKKVMSMHPTYQSCRASLINPVVDNTPGLKCLPYCPAMHGSHTVYSVSQVLGPGQKGLPGDFCV